MNTIGTILLYGAGAYALLLLFMYLAQQRLLYFPNLPGRDIVATPESIGLEFESVQMLSNDGLSLDGWYIPNKDSRPVILFFHGNAGNISHRLDAVEQFHRLGFSTLIFDYRGYGRSEGKPSEQGTYRDADAAWKYLIEERGFSENQIILLGRSLGAAIASQLATRYSPGALVIESTFTSLPDLAAELYRYVPVRKLSRYEYPVAHNLSKVSVPVLIVHSKEDELIPFQHGKELYATANEPKQFLEIHGTHDGGFLESGTMYEDALQEFLQTHLITTE